MSSTHEFSCKELDKKLSDNTNANNHIKKRAQGFCALYGDAVLRYDVVSICCEYQFSVGHTQEIASLLVSNSFLAKCYDDEEVFPRIVEAVGTSEHKKATAFEAGYIHYRYEFCLRFLAYEINFKNRVFICPCANNSWAHQDASLLSL